jgi:hypothetical protein
MRPDICNLSSFVVTGLNSLSYCCWKRRRRFLCESEQSPRQNKQARSTSLHIVITGSHLGLV